MKRKVIEWGHNSLAMTLPIKWTREQGIAKGAELEISILEGKLTVAPFDLTIKKKEVTLDVKGDIVSNLRLHVANAYRLGYDIIRVIADKKNKKVLSEMVEKIFIGFELFETETSFVLEAMPEIIS